MNGGTRLLTAATVGLVFACWGSAANAQVPTADQGCIAAFNKGVRKVAKAHSLVIRKCLKDFAAGNLTAFTPEVCVRSDPKNKVQRTVDKVTAKINDKCSGGIPGFGASPVGPALIQTVISEIDLIHSPFGFDLDSVITSDPAQAMCQSRAGAALLKCEDRRLRTYLKCQKTGLRNGAITDAASLSDNCLGIGTDPQPDPVDRIAQDCMATVLDEIGQNCGSVTLATAFPSCNPADASAATDCLNHKSACQFCLLLNQVDQLSRDCDELDDGDGSNGSCQSECSDGILQQNESCDDGNTNANDGCSATCTVEGGWTCTGQPSVCTQNCGNGALDAGENCDDGGTANGDGCNSQCFVESGYSCTGEPSVCTKNCGNGTIQSSEGEVCDDNNHNNGDGCSSTCHIEGGYNCSGEPSVCTFVCGNGTFESGETCDDGDAMSGDGCSSICQIETGWMCFGAPSVCSPICGDGLKRGAETCDDGNVQSSDGCSLSCQTEAGFVCTGQPSHCLAVCGDSFIRGFENCDDSNTISGDGCAGNFCRQEAGFTCAGQPSVCTPNCGNGLVTVPEECDDGNHINGDGCNGTCHVEAGYACGGQPSVCAPTCGNSLLNLNETCDDGNTVSGDGCSANCRNESGWLCLLPGTPCTKFDVIIDSPANGIFTTAATANISGHYTTLPPGSAAVTVNGMAASVNQVLRTFTATVPVSQTLIFNPVKATLTYTPNGDHVNDRIVIIGGNSVADGAYSPQSVAMRLNDSGLDAMEPLVGGLAAGQLDLATVLPAGTVLLDQCFINVIGCLGSAQVVIANPPPSFSHLTLGIDSMSPMPPSLPVGSVFGDIRIFDIRVDVNINGSGLVPSCGLRLTADSLRLTGNYSLEPQVGSPSNVDVNLITPLGVQFTGFNRTFTSGLCDAPIIGDIIQALLPNIEDAATNGIRDFLSDPDGNGPADSPIAAAIQSTLAGISISGAIGSGLGLMLDTPLFEVAEDNVGITLGSDAKFTVSIGSGPGQCIPPPGAPNLTASYSKPSVFPTFGANTPVGNQPYGLGICISAAGFNQLLRGQTECGLMRTSLTTIDLDGAGGNPPLAITSTLLSLIVPEFAQLPANTPLRIDVAPTVAPIVTGNPGPGGELTELKVAQVIMQIVEPGPEKVWLSGAMDTRLGFDLDFLPDGSGLAITLSPPLAGDVSIAVLDNPLGANETQVETVLPALVTPLIPQLAGALAGFPLPQFFGLQLDGVEVSRNGQFLSLFANLVPGP
jgi:cysteine-rich repeat protein